MVQAHLGELTRLVMAFASHYQASQLWGFQLRAEWGRSEGCQVLKPSGSLAAQ